jgi:drug/metabolite transporter (DMT)-like permease
LAALVSAVFFGLNAVASKLLFSSEAPAHFGAVALIVARGFWSLPLFLVLAIEDGVNAPSDNTHSAKKQTADGSEDTDYE